MKNDKMLRFDKEDDKIIYIWDIILDNITKLDERLKKLEEMHRKGK